MVFLSKSDNACGCYSNLKLPLTYNMVEEVKIGIANILMKILQKWSLGRSCEGDKTIVFALALAWAT